jgi:hypothetical protein
VCTDVEPNPAVCATKNSLGGNGLILFLAVWKPRNWSEERAVAQDRQTARKRRTDSTGSHWSTSIIISSGSTTGAPAPLAGETFLLLQLIITMVVKLKFAEKKESTAE